MYTSSAAANSENAEPSSASSRLKASQAKPAPSAKAVMCTTRKNSVGRSLIQLPQGIVLLLVFRYRRSWCGLRAPSLPRTAGNATSGGRHAPRRKSAGAPAGVSYDDLVATLERDGIEKFVARRGEV